MFVGTSECLLHDKKATKDLFKGLQVVDIRNLTEKISDNFEQQEQYTSNTSDVTFDVTSDVTSDGDLEAADVSTTVKRTCLMCSVYFDNRDYQVDHYKSDWHRYNLHQKLRGKELIGEERFEEIQGQSDLSSISGSDSEDEQLISSPGDEQQTYATSRHLTDDKKNEYTLTSRLPVIYFRNSEGKVLELYKCLLFSRKNSLDVASIQEIVLELPNKLYWIVILVGAGHFAAAVFENGEVLIHKTFHRYTVRAKRGTSQGQHDGQGKIAKSAGSNLRRYNEQALAQDITNLLQSWSEHIQKADKIFIRVPANNKQIFFGGKQAVFSKDDGRIQTIPFTTRRPTFKEVRHVLRLLSTVRCHDYETFISHQETITSIDSKEKLDVKIARAENEVNQDQAVQSKAHEENVVGYTLEETVNEKAHKKRRKKRETPELQKTDKEKETRPIASEDVNEKMCYNDDNSQNKSEEWTEMQNKLYTVCRLGNVDKLKDLLEVVGGNEDTNLDELVNFKYGESGDTLLMISAGHDHSGSGGHNYTRPDVVELLLEAGANPSKANFDGKFPYDVSSKSIRDVFRRFMAKYPDRYDYKTAKVPGPLTHEMELTRKEKESARKKAVKQLKKERTKERTKEKREEEQMIREEEQKKKQFLSLSDREKRALAADRRLVGQYKAMDQSLPILLRCWFCAKDITGQVPFEYFDFKFCSTKCLKAHRTSHSLSEIK